MYVKLFQLSTIFTLFSPVASLAQNITILYEQRAPYINTGAVFHIKLPLKEKN